VQPTIFVTVPRLLEKIYDNILKKGQQLTGLKQKIFGWALKLAKRYELGQKTTRWSALQLKLADKLVFSKWRAALGG
jgi:long-chain acyl-CoA synthetase